MKDNYHIEIDEKVKPVVKPTRKVALRLTNALKHSLEELEKSKIIAKVQGSSKWVKALVIVKKTNNQLRICLDPCNLNQAVKREFYKIPTLGQIRTNSKIKRT